MSALRKNKYVTQHTTLKRKHEDHCCGEHTEARRASGGCATTTRESEDDVGRRGEQMARWVLAREGGMQAGSAEERCLSTEWVQVDLP